MDDDIVVIEEVEDKRPSSAIAPLSSSTVKRICLDNTPKNCLDQANSYIIPLKFFKDFSSFLNPDTEEMYVHQLDTNIANANKASLVKRLDAQKLGLDKHMQQATSLINFNKLPVNDNQPMNAHVAGGPPKRNNPAGNEGLSSVDLLTSEVQNMTDVTEQQFQQYSISSLPKEMALRVLSFLEPQDLLKVAQTCHYWRILAEDNLLWRDKCKEEQIDNIPEVSGESQSCYAISANNCTNSSQIIPSPWKAAYMRQHIIEMNWKNNTIQPPKVLRGHRSFSITCLQFSGDRIVTGSDDYTLKVWSATTGKCLQTLVGHTGGVWSSQMCLNIIISGSTDRTLKVWNADTGQCIHTMYGHTSTVRCMHLHGNNRVVSGSRDATLRVWDVDTGKCLHVLVGHAAEIRCVLCRGNIVISGSYDHMVKVWNPEKEECIHTLQGHTDKVYSIQFDGIHVVSASLDTSIRVWDVDSGACKHTLMGHQSLISDMELRNNILVSGNADSTLKVWDISTGQCLHTLAGRNKHQREVTSLQIISKFVVTSSDDGTVKLWDLKTGKFLRNIVVLEYCGRGGMVWRIRASSTKLICAVGSNNNTEETKLLVFDFEGTAK